MARQSIHRTILLVFIGTVLQFTVSAQSTEAFTSRLSTPDSAGSSGIVVTTEGDAGSVIRMLESSRKRDKINGYRVSIFSDNGQNARDNAYSARGRFADSFEGIPVDVEYDNPYFRVSAGYCLTKEEAIMLEGRIKGLFDKAFIKREQFPITDLVR